MMFEVVSRGEGMRSATAVDEVATVSKGLLNHFKKTFEAGSTYLPGR